jgi:hypothetical protein
MFANCRALSFGFKVVQLFYGTTLHRIMVNSFAFKSEFPKSYGNLLGNAVLYPFYVEIMLQRRSLRKFMKSLMKYTLRSHFLNLITLTKTQ